MPYGIIFIPATIVFLICVVAEIYMFKKPKFERDDESITNTAIIGLISFALIIVSSFSDLSNAWSTFKDGTSETSTKVLSITFSTRRGCEEVPERDINYTVLWKRTDNNLLECFNLIDNRTPEWTDNKFFVFEPYRSIKPKELLCDNGGWCYNQIPERDEGMKETLACNPFSFDEEMDELRPVNEWKCKCRFDWQYEYGKTRKQYCYDYLFSNTNVTTTVKTSFYWQLPKKSESSEIKLEQVNRTFINESLSINETIVKNGTYESVYVHKVMK